MELYICLQSLLQQLLKIAKQHKELIMVISGLVLIVDKMICNKQPLK